MVRYLLHNSDATYDVAAKTWYFHLDRRISNPTRLKLNKATFSPVSNLSPMPHVIYMHSRALSDMILEKHTVVLKGEAHENSTDVIAVLEETHTRGRYALKEKDSVFRVNPHSVKRSIDIYFTDGTGANLDGEIAGAPPPPPSGSADDATIVAIGSDINLWLDFSDFSRMLMPTYAPVGVVGDEIRYLQNKTPGPATFFFTASSNDFFLAEFGESYGMLGNGSWEFASDTSDNNPVATLPYTFSWMMKVQATPAHGVIWAMQNFLDCRLTTSNTLEYLTQTSGWQSITALNFLPGQDFWCQVVCDDPDGDGNFSFFWTFRNLSTGVEYTEETEGRWPTGLTLNAGTNYYIGFASTGMKSLVSHAVFLDNIDATDIATVKTWMLAKYGIADDEEVPAAAPTEDATFFCELDINTR
jgi:hypothetical protein